MYCAVAFHIPIIFISRAIALICGSECKRFSFNHYTAMCRSYYSCHILNMTSDTGWQSYLSPSLNTLGK